MLIKLQLGQVIEWVSSLNSQNSPRCEDYKTVHRDTKVDLATIDIVVLRIFEEKNETQTSDHALTVNLIRKNLIVNLCRYNCNQNLAVVHFYIETFGNAFEFSF